MSRNHSPHRFALLGIAGFVAPRHIAAIKNTHNELICCLDPHDSVGIIDSFFPNCDYFSEFERFDRHVNKLAGDDQTKLDYLSICSPNYLHDSHVRFGLRSGMKVICEKPLVLNPWNLDELKRIEVETKKKVSNILQLRLHPQVIELKKQTFNPSRKTKLAVKLIYITQRGNWYRHSWKGNEAKSGGIATNIGIHLFDMITNLFGAVEKTEVYFKSPETCHGLTVLQSAEVEWLLSIDKDILPENNSPPLRALKIGNESFDFTSGFTDLHTRSYEHVFETGGFGIEDTRPAVELVHEIRNIEPQTQDTKDLGSILKEI